jgi:hypothetical protein
MISETWPKKKDFIEGAYKILLFNKKIKKEVIYAMGKLR